MAFQFDGHLGDPVLLTKMDKLREMGISDYVQLPQLVVVGDQSSGKSSVLEGLTELPFPRDSTLCTRFATQIVFRRAAHESILVSIIPSTSSNAARVERLREFKDEGSKALSAEGFKDLLNKASDAMGIPAPGSEREEGQSAFSDDVFRIELSGPTRSHLSVIDVPGIFRTTIEGSTTEKDKLLVQRMVQRYIENPRTIILAVLAANVDIATTEILEMAAKVDSSGQRTLGILTKPDLVDEGAEQDIIDIVGGKKNKLKLGYCVVRNRGKKERDATVAERHQVESDFFKANPWSSLDTDRVGISALSLRLRDLLGRVTRREFPKVVRDISNRLLACEKELQDLGPSRQTPEQQRKYLMEIATRFQEITTYALEAQYGRHELLKDDTNLRLATLIVDFNLAFSESLEKRGHTVKFTETKLLDGKSFLKFDLSRQRKLIFKDASDGSATKSEPDDDDENASGINSLDYPELADVLPAVSVASPLPPEDIMEWIEREYKTSRGFELGTFNPAILQTLFQVLSAKWENLAAEYVNNIVSSIHHFCKTVLELLCTEERTEAALWSLLMDNLLQRYRRAVKHVQFILQTERSGNLLTINRNFSKTLDDLRSKRLADQEDGSKVQESDDGNQEHTMGDIHDILKSYYEVSQRRFVDNVCLQGTDYHLVTGPDTPLRVLSSGFVVDLSVEQLEAVAGEDNISVLRRKVLEREIESLSDGRRILTT